MKDLKDMSYKELQQLKKELEVALKDNEFADRILRHSKYQRGVEARQRAKEKFLKEVAPKLREFAKQLKPGDLLSFKGTKGSAIRRVIEVKGDHILGLVMTKTHNGWISNGYSSVNMVDNIKSVFTDKGWKPIKEVIDGIQQVQG